MKKSLRLILPLLCALLFLDAQASLQQPVQVTAVMIPPYGNYLSDYYAGTEERMSVTLLNRDVMQPEIRVKLRLTIRTSSGATLTTRPEAYFPPIALESNVPRRLMMTDLAPYFSRGSLSNANALANETLPEGFCQFTIEAVEYYTGRTVSGKTTAVAFLQLLKPAKLISPTNKENVLFQEPLNLVFRWQPVTSSGYGAPEYEFTLKEIDDKQANVEAAFLYARTVYQTTTQNTLLPYTADLPMLENGKRYAWQVKASLPTETKNRFQNNGYSEVWLFDLREDCKPPIGLTAEPTHDMMLLKWQPAQGAANYNIQYRREDFDSNVWHDKPADAANSLINDIAKGHSYVFRVGSVCEDGNVVYSTEKTAFMPLQDEEQIKNCGKEPDIDLSNREPKEYLGIGDVFYCADYPVTITEVTGGNGIFSGKGYAPFPLFGALPVNVTFSNVSINADNRMTEGSVAAVRDEGNSLMSNLDRLTEGGTQKLEQGIIKPDIIVDYAIPPTATLTYDSIADTYTIEDENHTPLGDLRMPKNEQGEPVFPVIVMDKDSSLLMLNGDTVPETIEKQEDKFIKLAEEDEEKKLITDSILKIVFPKTPIERLKLIADCINEYGESIGLTTPERLAAFVAQTGYESNGFNGKSGESACYSEKNEEGWKIWFNLTWKEPPFGKDYDKDLNPPVSRAKKLKWTAYNCGLNILTCTAVPEKFKCSSTNKGDALARVFFSYVYQCEGGNGNSSTMDGYKYRGHGAIQLTWKKNYEAFDNWLKNNYPEKYKNIVENPSLIDSDIDLYMLSAMWFWDANNLNNYDEFRKVTLKINAQAIDFEKRKEYYTKLKNLLE